MSICPVYGGQSTSPPEIASPASTRPFIASRSPVAGARWRQAQGAARNGPALDRQPPPRHWRGLHDRRRRLPERGEGVDDLLEVLDVADVELHEEAVFASDPVALDDLWRSLRDVGHLGDLAGRRADAQDRAERVPERAR